MAVLRHQLRLSESDWPRAGWQQPGVARPLFGITTAENGQPAATGRWWRCWRKAAQVYAAHAAGLAPGPAPTGPCQLLWRLSARPRCHQDRAGLPCPGPLGRDEAPMNRSAHGVPFPSCRICPSTNPAAPACPWAGAKSASPRQARPDYRRWAWVTPLACGLKPSGNRTVKTLHRSVFSQSSGRAVSSLAARFPKRFSPVVFGLHPITPTPARHKNAMRCFHQSS